MANEFYDQNTLTFTGNLAAAPELKSDKNGAEYASMSVYVQKGAQGADIYSCTAYGKALEAVKENDFQKGQKVQCAGSLNVRVDEKTGKVYTNIKLFDISPKVYERAAQSAEARAEKAQELQEQFVDELDR